jgi:hypothetical protein
MRSTHHLVVGLEFPVWGHVHLAMLRGSHKEDKPALLGNSLQVCNVGLGFVMWRVLRHETM